MTSRDCAPVVLHVCLSLGWGGLEMYPIRIGTAQRQRGMRVYALALEGSRIAQDMQTAGIEVLTVPSRTRAILQLPRLLHWVRDRGITVVHSHKSADLLLLALLKSFAPLRLIFTEHMGAKRPKKDWLHRWIYGHVDMVLSISDETLKRNRAALPLPPEKIQRLWLGTELQRCDEAPESIRAELDIGPGPVIGMVGRMTPGKGQRELLEAFCLLKANHPQLQLLLVGGLHASEGANEQFVAELQRVIAERHLIDAVHMPGFRRDTPRMLQAMDVVVIPSHNEAFGLTVIEAMAAAKPIVGSSRGAIPEVLGEAGLLADPLLPDSIAAQIEIVLPSSRRATALAEQALHRVRSFFSIDSHMAVLNSYYLGR